jgi:hypothetical protein
MRQFLCNLFVQTDERKRKELLWLVGWSVETPAFAKEIKKNFNSFFMRELRTL